MNYLSSAARLFLFSVALLSAASSAQSIEMLLFPVEKNNVQVLPQRFEYLLLNKNQFRVGDILIDSSEIDLQLQTNAKYANKHKFLFKWPGDLVQDGELLIQDNAGKSLWTQKISSADLKLIKPKSQNSEDSADVRSIVATFQSSTIDNSLLERLQLNAFFRFCARKELTDTRIYICSRDLYIKKVKTKYSILNRESFRKDSFVEINGRPVDPKGIVFLNEVTDNISLRALMESGARLEIDTHRKFVEFTDVVQSEDGQQIIIRAHGTEPVDPSLVTRKGPEEWEATVPIDRPTLYLKGEGNIPMRQEFFVAKKIRTDAVKVEVLDGAETKTYESQIQIKLKPANGLTITTQDKKSVLTRDHTWTLKQLDKGATNHRYLSVTAPDGKYIAAYEVYRGFQFEANARLMLPLFAEAQGLWWINQRLGTNLTYDTILAKPASDPTWTNLKGELLYRFKPGLQHYDPSLGLSMFFNQVSSGSSASLLGLGAFANIKSPWPGPVHWFYGRFGLPLAKVSTELTLKTSWDFEVAARHFTKDVQYYEMGIRSMKYNLSSETQEINYAKTLIFAGLGFLF